MPLAPWVTPPWLTSDLSHIHRHIPLCHSVLWTFQGLPPVTTLLSISCGTSISQKEVLSMPLGAIDNKGKGQWINLLQTLQAEFLEDISIVLGVPE